MSRTATAETAATPSPHPPGTTPVMAQFLDMKAAHPDCLLFFRMGDFYEMFFEDAVVAAEALGIALTKRGKTAGEEIPMCGVPHHQAERYLHDLIRKGFRVAVAEQMEDPAGSEETRLQGGRTAGSDAACHRRHAHGGGVARRRPPQLPRRLCDGGARRRVGLGRRLDRRFPGRALSKLGVVGGAGATGPRRSSVEDAARRLGGATGRGDRGGRRRAAQPGVRAETRRETGGRSARRRDA